MTRKLLLLLSVLMITGSLTAQNKSAATDQDIAALQQQIDAKGYHWIAGRTTVSDLSDEEQQNMLGFKPPKGYQEWLAKQPKFKASRTMSLPAVFDWRDSGIMTPVKNQGQCGSCWAFGAVGAFEAAVKRHDGIEYDLSEQQVLSCNIYGSSCEGGWAEPVFELFKRYGAVAETCIPYQANDALPCTQDQCEVLVKLKDWVYVDTSVAAIKEAVLQGPVVSSFSVWSDFSNYTSGCYQQTSGYYRAGHLIVIVGWDDNACGDGQGAWICKNSWGPGWAELGGYFYIKWGDCGIGSGVVRPIYPPDSVIFSIDNHQIDDAAGDNDKIPDPGESFLLPISIKNDGMTTATGVQAILHTSTGKIQITDSIADFPDVPSGQVVSSLSPHFAMTVDPSVEPGTRLDFTLEINSAQGNTTQSFYDYVGRFDTVFVDDMESGSGNWTHDGTLDDWQYGAPTGVGKTDAKAAHSGSSIWGNNLSGSYSANASNYLESGVIDCSSISHTKLRYYRWLASEKGIYDHARILVNGNKVWENDSSYDQIDGQWNYHDIDISSIADGNASVKVRFEMQSDGGLQLGGWNIDDVAIAGTPYYAMGDANSDRIVDVSDVVFLIAYIFSGGSAPVPNTAGDANCDAIVDISDAVFLISYIFGGGSGPGCK
jgi:C1A family cysteine protease